MNLRGATRAPWITQFNSMLDACTERRQCQDGRITWRAERDSMALWQNASCLWMAHQSDLPLPSGHNRISSMIRSVSSYRLPHLSSNSLGDRGNRVRPEQCQLQRFTPQEGEFVAGELLIDTLRVTLLDEGAQVERAPGFIISSQTVHAATGAGAIATQRILNCESAREESATPTPNRSNCQSNQAVHTWLVDGILSMGLKIA